jgi:hypothetical protein
MDDPPRSRCGHVPRHGNGDGDGFQIPPNTPHAGGKPGTAKTRILITSVVEKGKPLASPVAS